MGLGSGLTIQHLHPNEQPTDGWSNSGRCGARELTQQFGDGQQQVAAAAVTSVTALGVDTVQMSHATGKVRFRCEVVE